LTTREEAEWRRKPARPRRSGSGSSSATLTSPLLGRDFDCLPPGLDLDAQLVSGPHRQRPRNSCDRRRMIRTRGLEIALDPSASSSRSVYTAARDSIHGRSCRSERASHRLWMEVRIEFGCESLDSACLVDRTRPERRSGPTASFAPISLASLLPSWSCPQFGAADSASHCVRCQRALPFREPLVCPADLLVQSHRLGQATGVSLESTSSSSVVQIVSESRDERRWCIDVQCGVPSPPGSEQQLHNDHRNVGNQVRYGSRLYSMQCLPLKPMQMIFLRGAASCRDPCWGNRLRTSCSVQTNTSSWAAPGSGWNGVPPQEVLCAKTLVSRSQG